MVLYSFGFAAFIFHVLPSEAAGPIIRRAFPFFYLFVIISSAIPAILIFPLEAVAVPVSPVRVSRTLAPPDADQVAVDTPPTVETDVSTYELFVAVLIHLLPKG